MVEPLRVSIHAFSNWPVSYFLTKKSLGKERVRHELVSVRAGACASQFIPEILELVDRSMARRQRGASFTATGLLALAVVSAAIAASSAQPQQQPPQPPGQPASAPSCPPVQASLSPCVSYFIGNSSTPSDACCEQMRAMLQSQAPCLCAAVASAPSSPLAPVLGGVQSLLPSACNLPPNACAGSTAGSASSPADDSTAPPSSGTTTAAAPEPAGTDPAAMPAGGGSKSVPTMPYSAATGGHGDGGDAIAAAVLISSLLACAYMI
ncbi:non-specific lipid transfer protein GPI-anchored 15-like [Oryza brachyantha]|uniref:non-specific lipid transfer protein GPI-anchored 15-like n=1 Tax=Oryza brachyantha TaxID=4533 RepID=UPI001ADA0822|nr:non-specific lipid transfer protein GPI-anchored 15-like [Oryza brachyantha]